MTGDADAGRFGAALNKLFCCSWKPPSSNFLLHLCRKQLYPWNRRGVLPVLTALRPF
jgi:hypothetical protein